MKIIIGENAYEADRQYIDNSLKVAKDNYIKKNNNALYALEKDGIINMMRETFITRKQLHEKVESYEKLGFKCYFVIKK